MVRTFDLLEAFPVDLGNYVLLLLKSPQTLRQWDGHLERVILDGAIVFRLWILKRRFHLPDGLDDPMRLLSQLVFLPILRQKANSQKSGSGHLQRDTFQMAVEGF